MNVPQVDHFPSGRLVSFSSGARRTRLDTFCAAQPLHASNQ